MVKSVGQLRLDFPILQEKVNGYSLVYVDNAATSQKPQAVIDALVNFYTKHNANIHRGVHTFGEIATTLYEDARNNVAQFINAQSQEVVFTSGATAAINTVAHAWALNNCKLGDEILVTELEHHSNLLPWQDVCAKTGATLKFIPVNVDGTLEYEKLPELVTNKTKLVAVTHTSNVFGLTTDLEKIITRAHAAGAKVLVDASQSIAHQKIDVQKIACDFLVFSGHKMLAPTGIGVLFIKKDLHNTIEPYQRGGGMVFEVDAHSAQWLKVPQVFEAGTPPIAQAIGLGAAIDYINDYINLDALKVHEAQLCARLIDGFKMLPYITVLGDVDELKTIGHLVSFTVQGMHPHDVAAYFNNFGICVRAGHHCAQPLAKKIGINASVRISFYCYNTTKEVDFILEIMEQLVSQIG